MVCTWLNKEGALVVNEGEGVFVIAGFVVGSSAEIHAWLREHVSN